MLRQQMKPTNRIHCTIVDGGEKPNIIPERSELSYYVRARTDIEVKELLGRLRKCAEGAAAATGNHFFKFPSEPYTENLYNLHPDR